MKRSRRPRSSPTRLVTLIGPGGVGKTRLAIEAATAATEAFPDGILFVDLAPLAEPDAVVHAFAVAAHLLVRRRTRRCSPRSSPRLRGSGPRWSLTTANTSWTPRAELVEAVSAGRDGQRHPGHEREPLRLPSEHVWQVAASRARARRGRALLRPGRGRVRRHSHRADEHPMLVPRSAGSSTACRSPSSSPPPRAVDVAQPARPGLDDRFHLLRSSGRGGVVERHQTLQATVEWSYRLLSDRQRLLFDRLSVFAGSSTSTRSRPSAVTEPMDPSTSLDPGSLVDKSLVHVDRPGIDARYRLLETLRQFGARLRRTRPSTPLQLRDRHLMHFTEVAAIAREHFEGLGNDLGRAIFAREWDELRAALDWASETGETADVAGQLIRSSSSPGGRSRVEHDDWAQKLVGPDGPPDPELLAIAGLWMMYRGDREDYLAGEALDYGPSRLRQRPTTRRQHWADGRSPRRVPSSQACLPKKHGRLIERPDEPTNHDNPFLAAMVIAWSAPSATFEPEALPGLVAAASARMAGIDNATMDAYLSYHRGNASSRTATSTAPWRIGAGVHTWRRDLAISSLRSVPCWSWPSALRRLVVTITMPCTAMPWSASRGGRCCRYRSFALTGLAFWWADTGRLEDAACILGFLSGQGEGYAGLADLRAAAIRLVEQDPHRLAGLPRVRR